MMFLGKTLSPALRLAFPPRGKAGSSRSAHAPASSVGEQEPAGRVDDGFSEQRCAIWNDIRRALDGGGK